MTPLWGCAEIRGALGVYVVGAIDPADRAVVESHLAWCAACREELASLAGLPGRLGSVPSADVTMLVLDEPGRASRDDPPEAALRSLLVRAAAWRRRLLWRRVAAGAAVAVIAAGGAAAVARAVAPAGLRPVASARPWAAAAYGRDPRTGAAATVRYQARPWGLQMQVQVSGLAPGTRCELLIVGPRGRLVAGGWTVAAGHTGAWYPASAPLAASGVRHFAVATASGKTLVSVPVR